MRVWRGIGFLAAGCLVVGISACTVAGPGSSGQPDQAHQQARAALARWDAAVAAGAESSGFVLVGETTLMIGEDWGPNIDGGNAKLAWYSGLFEVSSPLPSDTPADAQARWKDGTTRTVHVISAQQALSELKAEGSGSYPGTTPLQITGAKLTTATFDTSRGPATAPAWEFSLKDTDVKLDQVAVAKGSGAAAVPTVNPNDTPQPSSDWIGPSVDSATIDSTGLILTVHFVGAEGAGDKPCGADYAVEAVESDNGVVAIVYEHRNPLPVPCDAVGYFRTAAVTLAKPLGNRTLIDLSAQPISVTTTP